MCTAVTYKTTDHYFGRNLDLEYSYKEAVTITPCHYPLRFRGRGKISVHFAMIGMAYVVDDYPLYYDATNEKGLSMAGLYFPECADYKDYTEHKENITPFEFIPWLLGQCADVSEAEKLLGNVNLWKQDFCAELPLSPLHWIISDRERSITVEAVREGLRIYENPVGVLTNLPAFPKQMEQLNAFYKKENRQLPGDFSSESRFIRAAFVRENSVSGHSERESVSQFFHILRAVEMPRGCVRAEDGRYKITVYSSCCNTDKGIYYYTTYENSTVRAVDMHQENLEGQKLAVYVLS